MAGPKVPLSTRHLHLPVSQHHLQVLLEEDDSSTQTGSEAGEGRALLSSLHGCSVVLESQSLGEQTEVTAGRLYTIVILGKKIIHSFNKFVLLEN